MKNGMGSFKVLEDPMDRVRAPPKGHPGKDAEAENVHLTSGKAVPQRRGLWIVAAIVVILIAGVIGAVIGILLAKYHKKAVGQLLSVVPFMPMPTAPLNFLIVGDWGLNGTNSQIAVATAMTTVAEQISADFVVSTGDNFYPDGLHSINDTLFKTSFIDIYTGLSKPWYAPLGDKDYHKNPGAEIDVVLNTIDSRWHADDNFRRKFKACPDYVQTNDGGFCEHTVELFFVDTSPIIGEYWQANSGLNFTALTDQGKAINDILNVLLDGLESSDATWKIVVGHHPVYSSVDGGYPDLQNFFIRQFQQYDVDLYINGHEHCQEMVTSPDVKTFFITTGAGAIGSAERRGEFPGASLFFSADPGFIGVSVTGPELNVLFFNSTASLLYNATLSKT